MPPEMPPPSAPAEAAPEEEAPAGPDFEALAQNLAEVMQSDAPDGVKQAAEGLLMALQEAVEGASPTSGATTPEQGGASGAVPMSPAGPRG